MSETAKYRHLTERFCFGSGIDVGSGGDPVVPWAISVDLPAESFAAYNSGRTPENAIHLCVPSDNLPFKDGALDFVYSSHLLEDFSDWTPHLAEWSRVLKPGGTLVILIPEKELFMDAMRRGQPPNCAHKHEGRVGELTEHFSKAPLAGLIHTEIDTLTRVHPSDYSILFVGTKR